MVLELGSWKVTGWVGDEGAVGGAVISTGGAGNCSRRPWESSEIWERLWDRSLSTEFVELLMRRRTLRGLTIGRPLFPDAFEATLVS